MSPSTEDIPDQEQKFILYLYIAVPSGCEAVFGPYHFFVAFSYLLN